MDTCSRSLQVAKGRFSRACAATCRGPLQNVVLPSPASLRDEWGPIDLPPHQKIQRRSAMRSGAAAYCADLSEYGNIQVMTGPTTATSNSTAADDSGLKDRRSPNGAHLCKPVQALRSLMLAVHAPVVRIRGFPLRSGEYRSARRASLRRHPRFALTLQVHASSQTLLLPPVRDETVAPQSETSVK